MGLQKYSSLRESARPSLESLLPLPFPLSIYIETTNRCIFRCRYCPMSLPGYAQTVGGFRTMTLAEFIKIAQDIKSGGLLKVLRFYFMGEPLLNPELPKMIKTACKMNLAQRTELTSNGVLLDTEKSVALVNSGLDYLRISISSVDPVRHGQVTQTSVSVEEIFDNIRSFRNTRDKMGSVKPFLYVKLLDPLNQAETQRFLEMYGSVADETAIEKPMNWNNYEKRNLIEATYGSDVSAERNDLYPYPKEVCPFPFYTLMVNVNGDVTTCCVDWNKATRVGNVFESGLKSIWNGEQLRNLRQIHITRRRVLNPSCGNCTFLYTVPDNLDNMSESTIHAVLGNGG